MTHPTTVDGDGGKRGSVMLCGCQVLTCKSNHGTRPECSPCFSPFRKHLRDTVQLLRGGCELEKMIPDRGANLTLGLSFGHQACTSKLIQLFKSRISVILSTGRDGGIVRGNVLEKGLGGLGRGPF